MTTHHVSGTRDFFGALDVGAAGDRYILHAAEYDGLDSYTQRMQGGATWGTRTVIEAYKRTGQPRDRVVFLPRGEFCIHLAYATARNVEFIGIDRDGQGVATNCDKVTWHGPEEQREANTASHVRFTGGELRNSLHSGGMHSAPHVEYVGGGAVDCGRSLAATDANKDHALYFGAYGDYGRTLDFSTYRSGAYGIHVWGANYVSVEGGKHEHNGVLAKRSAVILSGVGCSVRRIIAYGNQYGVQVDASAREWSVEDSWLEGNRDGRIYIHPDAAVHGFERGNVPRVA